MMHQQQPIVPLSTHAHYSKSETNEDMHELARSFLLHLNQVIVLI